MMYSGDDYYGDEITSPLTRDLPALDHGQDDDELLDDIANYHRAQDDAERTALAVLTAAGADIVIDPEGYALHVAGDYCGTFTTIEALSEAFAERESDRIAGLIDRSDAAIARNAQVAEENERLTAQRDMLLGACAAAMDWIARFGADAPIVFGGEAELYERLSAAIEEATK